MKRASKVFTILLVLIAFILSPIQPGKVKAEPSLQTTPCFISGRVTDKNGNGVAGATIAAVLDSPGNNLSNENCPDTPSEIPASTPIESGGNYYTVETDADGYYNLDSLPPGSYLISARKTGYDFSPLSYEVNTTSGGSNYDFHEEVVATVLAPGTIILSEATLAELVSVSSDGTTYTFASKTSDLAQVDVGDVLVGGVSPLTPAGLLRKVVLITTNGSQFVVVTKQATLTEAFESLSVNINIQLTPAQVQTPPNIAGNSKFKRELWRLRGTVFPATE